VIRRFRLPDIAAKGTRLAEFFMTVAIQTFLSHRNFFQHDP
jgi:hypothetical protein